MATHIESSSTPQGFQRPDIGGHEKSDVAVKWVFGFMFALLGGGVMIHFFIAWQLNHLRKTPVRPDTWAGSRHAEVKDVPQYNYPRLQLSPPADLDNFMNREHAVLHSYGWINKTSGLVRIPIERAMDLLLETESRGATQDIGTGISTLQLQQERPLKRQRESGEPK